MNELNNAALEVISLAEAKTARALVKEGFEGWLSAILAKPGVSQDLKKRAIAQLDRADAYRYPVRAL